MKKFYISIFTAVFLLSSFLSRAQVFTSITDGNPNGYTLDDPRFWQGDTPPPNPCTGCTIKINSNGTMVHGPGFTTSDWGVLLRTSAPATGPFNDLDGPITVGLKFNTTIATTVTGVKFYKQPGMIGTHTGILYNNAGLEVTRVDFVGESASGWQEMPFGGPVSLPANTTYTIAVYMADGTYAATQHGLAADVTHGVLTAPASTGPNPNGVFTKDIVIGTAGPHLPTSGNLESNYWVDAAVQIDGTFLNNVLLTNSTVNLYGNTTFTLNTYLRLVNSSVILGNDPVSAEAIKLNDQMDLNGTSFVQLANNLTSIDATNLGGTIIGPHDEVGSPGLKGPGIYAINAGDPLGYTATLQENGLGSQTDQYFPPPLLLNYYSLNCDPAVVGSPNSCQDGVVFGPALTQLTADPGVGIVFLQSTTLPVQLVQFLATKAGDGSIKLSWSTSQEVNAGYYDVERSGDQTGWTKIGSIKAKGNTSTTTDYSFSDKLPLDGTGYYRLKMVDLDGKYVYSKTVSVAADKNSVPLVIYSNPFSDLIRLKVNVSRAQNLTMTVSDMMGKVYINKSVQAQSGDNLINLQPSVIGGSGMYILRIQGDSYSQTAKIEKQ